jgi:hypothetical protein
LAGDELKPVGRLLIGGKLKGGVDACAIMYQ